MHKVCAFPNILHIETIPQSEQKLSEPVEEADSSDKPSATGDRPSSGHEAVWIPGKHQVETVGKTSGRSPCPKGRRVDGERVLNTVEFFSRLLFPLTFIFLNIAYWLYYTILVDQWKDE